MPSPSPSPSPIPNPNPVKAPPHIHALLNRLHTESSTQEASLGQYLSQTPDFDTRMRDKFIALDQDKCQFVYQLARAINARHVVEVGTSFGVSTIYLALAVGSNVAASRGTGTGTGSGVGEGGGGSGGKDAGEGEGKRKGIVIATEKEASKAAQARAYWAEAGEELVARHIDLRVGDLRETLREDIPILDLVLLDIWAPMALPALQLLEPHMRAGAVVIVDNSVGSAVAYTELLAHLRAPESGYTNITLPYSKGLEMCVRH